MLQELNKGIQKQARSFRKKKIKKEQLQHIISLRISDSERQRLESLTRATSKSISAIMREAIDLWSSQQRALCLEECH